MQLWHLAVLLTAFYNCESARILVVIPTFTKSHFAATGKILQELSNRGHQIVSISPFEIKSQNITWIPIEVKSIFDAVPSIQKDLNKELDFFSSQHRLYKFTNEYSSYVVTRPKLKHFIETDDSHFDLVIAEEFYQEVFFIFAHKYKAPLIILSSFGPAHYINEYVGNAYELAYVPHEFIDFFGQMSLLQRMKNVVYSVVDMTFRKYYSLEFQNELAKKVFKNVPNLPHVGELERNASLVLLNSHFSLNVVRPYLPNMIEIAGSHIEEVKPLSKEFKDILDKDKDGVILFSLGSVIDLSVQSEEFIKAILTALGQSKHTVILKWASEKPLPLHFDNIKAFSWLPQNDILAHPNLTLFITHGGLHSAIETIYHGVASICIPFYGDQKLNCKKSEHMGFGSHLARSDIGKLGELIKNIMSDKKYMERAKELSKRFKDRPLSPVNSAAFWIEYVIRHNGADFIKSPKRYMHWISYCCLDVIAIIVTCFIAAVLVVRKCFRLVCGGSSKKVKVN